MAPYILHASTALSVTTPVTISLALAVGALLMSAARAMFKAEELARHMSKLEEQVQELEKRTRSAENSIAVVATTLGRLEEGQRALRDELREIGQLMLKKVERN